MVAGILFIIIGIICYVVPTFDWYKESVEKHNHNELESYMNTVRSVLGAIFIFMGIFAIGIDIINLVLL
ncbi:MAG: hypothetical protein RR620_00345 [Clostridium sp.]